ncbi:preprotein translocase subunit SecG [Novosphingopyxis sp. YJ-S2-01]|uniref:preprotein translocase subunit SecG n=1 Tax=Novosphingopyxis sp. YJ-S2-01 TaxID=2794021 RepID=UPI0018DDB4BC|nr:preprotein translocase subunit SecG [Novosphingopyxis sp. YJ-S2-01]MBH9538088.1 preprotein translocase subunit SecG [Novosphingopyxis sp. YJ-S2-01]
MTLFHFLIVVQAIVGAALVGIILMQQSEGGGLGMGGSPSGLMSARGAANFLTRGTTVLAILFVTLSIALAVVAAKSGAPSEIDTSFERRAPAADGSGELPVGTVPGDPVPASAPPGATDTAPGQDAPAGNAVPLDK